MIDDRVRQNATREIRGLVDLAREKILTTVRAFIDDMATVPGWALDTASMRGRFRRVVDAHVLRTVAPHVPKIVERARETHMTELLGDDAAEIAAMLLAEDVAVARVGMDACGVFVDVSGGGMHACFLLFTRAEVDALLDPASDRSARDLDDHQEPAIASSDHDAPNKRSLCEGAQHPGEVR